MSGNNMCGNQRSMLRKLILVTAILKTKKKKQDSLKKALLHSSKDQQKEGEHDCNI